VYIAAIWTRNSTHYDSTICKLYYELQVDSIKQILYGNQFCKDNVMAGCKEPVAEQLSNSSYISCLKPKSSRIILNSLLLRESLCFGVIFKAITSNLEIAIKRLLLICNERPVYLRSRELKSRLIQSHLKGGQVANRG
jgi:hypothetical protein